MSFHPISTTVPSAKTWNETGAGQYSDSTVLFGQPRSYLRITRGKPNSKTGLTTASISKTFEKSVLENGEAKIRSMSVSISIAIPTHPDFTVLSVDESLATLNEFVTGATLDRILKGEQ